MSRCPELVACHKLDVNSNAKPVKQKPRRMDLDRRARVQAEVDRLLLVNFSEEAKYSRWVSNIVAVPKKRMA